MLFKIEKVMTILNSHEKNVVLPILADRSLLQRVFKKTQTGVTAV
jgi:hypothetical protein